MKSKVVLATPPHTSEAEMTRLGPLLPLGLAYVAATLEKSDIDVQVVDSTLMKYDVEETKEAILKLNPTIVGLTSYTSTIPSIYRLAQALKKESKDLIIIVGGPHVSALPSRTLEECTALNMTIVGEGEYAFRDAVLTLEKKGIDPELTNVPGVVFQHNKKIYGNLEPAFIENLNCLPFPARHLFDLGRYMEYSRKYSDAKKTPVGSILTSRGCPGQCVFCCKIGSGGTRFRVRSPDNVVDELRQLKEYGFREVQIQDDTFTFNRERVIDICKRIKEEGINLNFSLPNGIRVDRADEDLLSTMYDAGFYSVHFGIETGDDEVLKTIKKGTTVMQGKMAVHTAKKVGYFVGLYVIVGLPGSTIKSEEKTLQLVKEMDPDFLGVGMCIPYPGTPLWNAVEDSLKDIPWEAFTHAAIDKPIYVPEGMTSEHVKYYRLKILNEFYRRPQFWIKRFFNHPIWTLRRARTLLSIARKRGWVQI